MNLTNCGRHPTEAAAGVCTRCGDFVCAKCRAAFPTGLCSACATRPAQEEAPSGLARAALVGAILFALLSGGFLLALGGLSLLVTKSPSPLVLWNGGIGLVYFAIAVGLWKRAPWGYSWSSGTQGVNALLGVLNITQQQAAKPNTLVLAIMGTSLAFHVLGWICTRLARPLFQLPPRR